MAAAEQPSRGFGRSGDAVGNPGKRKVQKTGSPPKPVKQTARQPSRSAIPDHVANRMVRRVLLLSGVPTLLAMGVFVLSYVLINQGVARIEPIVTIGVSGVFFVAGLLGLSYGVLSASWDDAPGSLLGLEQFGANLQRLRTSIRGMKRGG